VGASPALDPAIFGAPGSRLLRDGSFPFRPRPTPQFPILARLGASINDFEPGLKPSYVSSWSFGIQREITSNMAFEIRYVGNHGTHLWRQYPFSEVNIFENGFLDEFKIAMNNLAIFRSVNPRCGQAGAPACNYGNTGLPGQRNIPIISGGIGSNTDLDTITSLQRGEAGRVAASIANDFTRMGRLTAAGLVPFVEIPDPSDPSRKIRLSNHFLVNPQSPTGAFIMTNSSDSTYNAMQIEFRRRMSKGLLVQGSYAWSKSLTNFYNSSSAAAFTPSTLRNFGYDKSVAPRDMRHQFKVDWLYELPIGPGQRFLNGRIPVIGKLLEGWQWGGVARIQSGTPTLLQSGRQTFNNRDAGVVLHNITLKELQKLVKMRKETVCDSAGNCQGVVFWLPKDIIENSQAAFEGAGKSLADLDPTRPFIGPPSNPGEFGQRIFLYGPWSSRFDFNIMKRTRIGERANFEFRVQFLNAFNQSALAIRDPDTNADTITVGGDAFGQTRNAYRDFTVSGTNDPGGRLIEFQLRLNF
jgi:hypothetical protein